MQMETEWFRKAREGDKEAIGKICAATWKPLYRFIFFKTGNRQEAEDITQETYSRALSAFGTKALHPEKYIGFLKKIALNILRDRWRQSKRRGVPVNLEFLDSAETSAPDPTEDALGREQIVDALNGLNDEQRTVIILRLIRGYSVSETAERMNRKEGNIRVLQYRALRALSEVLGDALLKGDN